jgi:methionyl-tRNA formyltransferase
MPNRNAARIVFMGTPDFAVPSLEALLAGGYNVVAVVTQPDRPKGRKLIPTPPPVKEAALRHGLQVLQPEKLRREEAIRQIADLGPDLIVTAAYGQILPRAVLDMPRYGCINVHASLLPKYRGGAPIHRSIMEGEKVTGVTIMYMAEGLDTGDMISRVEVPIEDDDHAGSLHDKLSSAGARLLAETLPRILDGTAEAVPQNEAEATYAPNIRREDERIDWNKTTLQVYNHIRGLHPWPVAYTLWNGEVLKVWWAEMRNPKGEERPREGRSGERDESVSRAEPGTVVRVADDAIEVRTADGSVWLTEIQPAGKRRMTVREFLRGGRIEAGTRLGG